MTAFLRLLPKVPFAMYNRRQSMNPYLGPISMVLLITMIPVVLDWLLIYQLKILFEPLSALGKGLITSLNLKPSICFYAGLFLNRFIRFRSLVTLGMLSTGLMGLSNAGIFFFFLCFRRFVVLNPFSLRFLLFIFTGKGTSKQISYLKKVYNSLWGPGQ